MAASHHHQVGRVRHTGLGGGACADACDRCAARTFTVWFGHSDQRKWHKCHVTRGPGYSRTCVSLDCLTPMQAQTDVLPGAAEFRAWADRPGGSRPAPALRLRRWRPWGSPPATEESATRVPREGPKFNPRITAAPACHLPPCLRLDRARGQMRRRPPWLSCRWHRAAGASLSDRATRRAAGHRRRRHQQRHREDWLRFAGVLAGHTQAHQGAHG